MCSVPALSDFLHLAGPAAVGCYECSVSYHKMTELGLIATVGRHSTFISRLPFSP